LAIPYRTPLDLKISRFKKGCEWETSDVRLQYKRSLPPKIRRKTSREKESRQFIARATQQVFPLCQPAIPLSQQLELRLQRDLSQSLQAQWWEPELSQE
jgi:hypothetical protein